MQQRHTRSTTAARPVAPPERASERPIEKPVDFVLKKPEAREVILAGTFNGWDLQRTRLHKFSEGWKTTLWLPPGRYEYKFVADGVWMADPSARDSAPNEFGSINSVVIVR